MRLRGSLVGIVVALAAACGTPAQVVGNIVPSRTTPIPTATAVILLEVTPRRPQPPAPTRPPIRNGESEQVAMSARTVMAALLDAPDCRMGRYCGTRGVARRLSSR